MKVSELIKQLQKYPQDVPVILEPDVFNVESPEPNEIAEDVVKKREKGLTLTLADATEFDAEENDYEFVIPNNLEDEERALHKNSKKRVCLIISSEYFEFYKDGTE